MSLSEKWLKIYIVTSDEYLDIKKIEEILYQSKEGGATCFQYRAKKKNAKIMYEESLIIKKITKYLNLPFIVNDRIDIAQAVNADGVHIGQEDLPPKVARKILGNTKTIGFSTHNLQQVESINKDNCIDYISFGPIFETKSKTYPPTGLEMLKEAVKISKYPVVAIGGINEKNAKEVIRTGCSGIAAISFFFSFDNIKLPCQIISNLWEES